MAWCSRKGRNGDAAQRRPAVRPPLVRERRHECTVRVWLRAVAVARCVGPVSQEQARFGAGIITELPQLGSLIHHAAEAGCIGQVDVGPRELCLEGSDAQPRRSWGRAIIEHSNFFETISGHVLHCCRAVVYRWSSSVVELRQTPAVMGSGGAALILPCSDPEACRIGAAGGAAAAAGMDSRASVAVHGVH